MRIFETELIRGILTLKKYNGTEPSVNIPEGIQSVGRNAFEKYKTITSVSMPKSMRYIEEEAFHCCDHLRELSLNEGLLEIRHRAFWYCSGLRTVTFPRSLYRLGSKAFECCSNLTDFSFLNPGIYVDEYAFNETPYWNKLWENSVHCTVGSGYQPCPSTLILPEGITHVDLWAYSKSLITSAILPNSLRTIGMCAFRDCPNLTEVTMTANVKCNSKYTTSPIDSVFSGCSRLEQLTLRGPLKEHFLEGFDLEKTFTGCTEFRRIIAWEIPLEQFPSAWQGYAINGYLNDAQRSEHYLPKIAAAYDRKLAQMKPQLIRRASSKNSFAFYQYLMEREFISETDYDRILDHARSFDNPEVVAALLEYHHDKLETHGISSLSEALDDLDFL